MTDRRIASPAEMERIVFDERGLVPVVAQDATTGAVLMVAWANEEAVAATLATGEVHFWSRSRNELWRKGETSGNVLKLRTLHADCDGDTVLALVDPTGPACHTGEDTCFGEAAGPAARLAPSGAPSGEVLAELWAVIDHRAKLLPDGSYTARLLGDENLRLKKLGEETAELITALAKGDETRVRNEAADLVYHLLAALRAADVSLDEVMDVLAERRR